MAAAIITITARLARDPELRRSTKGTSMVSLTLPVDTGWGDHKTTTWWRATLFGARAESAAQHLRKGSWVCVSGPASVREFEGKNGKGYSPEVTASTWSFVGPKENHHDSPAPARRQSEDVIPF
jgi:single-strand DNA-binding protein